MLAFLFYGVILVKIAVLVVPYPLFVRILIPLILLLAALTPEVLAQVSTDTSVPDAAATIQARIERARALAASHQLNAAAMELESLRSTVKDDAVRDVTSVMLMNICLEEGNYARAESLLEETFAARRARKDTSARTYFSLAGQAVNGARSHLARYRSFGINVSDDALPTEALNDLDRLRSLLERMSMQAKEIIRDEPKAFESLALLEDILGIRLSLARNEEDREKWEVERSNVRRGLIYAQTQVASNSSPSTTSLPADNSGSLGATATTKSVEFKAQASPASDPSAPETISTGSLNPRATRRVVPIYPPVARNASTQGIVRVYVTVDEEGNVSDVARTEGPPLLRGAAEDAARRWKFSPAAVEGKPVRLSGYIEFTFTL